MPGDQLKKTKGAKAMTDRLAGTFGEFRRAWVDVKGMTGVMFVKPDSYEGGCNVELAVNSGKTKFWTSLTSLTANELLAFKRLFDMAFEAALPICQARDERAMQALADGNTRYARAFRADPVLWKRVGPAFASTMEDLPDQWTGDTEEARRFERVVVGSDLDNPVITDLDESGTYGEE